MPSTRTRARSTPAAAFMPAWTPLVAALAAAMPMMVCAQSKAKATSASPVPVPAAHWRVYGSGGSAPVNTTNGNGGVDQVINQSSTKGIYNWQSFDIGSKSSVTFDMAQKGSSALNRVVGNAAPSQIFGTLKATNGGEIFLINQSGILFGAGSKVVDTGGLIASALNVKDSEYLSGFANSLSKPINPDDGTPNAAFRFDTSLTPAENFVDSQNFVRVDQGATITTTNGGRVFLFAKRVENGGTISTPGGQTVLGAGGEIYFKLPSSESGLYASETNPNVSALRGFLVEVAGGPGTASNLATGQILTPRGNATLVGMAVNQMGRISATTSVSENGSVILRAQGAAAYDSTSSTIRATESGALVIGANSQITISPDTTKDSSGAAPTSTDSAGFVTSHIDLAGQTVTFGNQAQIVAPGATVNVRAETVPTYAASLDSGSANVLKGGDTAARIVLGDGVNIDVSGTTDTVVSADRYFVTTELLGSNDLKDAPVQKDGLLYRSKVTVDIREDSNILGSLASYRAALGRTVGERLSAGGTVRLRAEGAVVSAASSNINVAGGLVQTTAATVRPTALIASDGTIYDVNNAPVDLVYVAATNLSKTSNVSYDRWGAKVAYGTRSSGHLEAGYTDGRSAGRLEVAAPKVLLQGQLQAGAAQGERQQAGQDSLASRGTLNVGTVKQGGDDLFLDSNSSRKDAVLESFVISDAGATVTAELAADGLNGALDGAASGLSYAQLQQADFGTIQVAANGAVTVQAKANGGTFQLGTLGQLGLLSVNDQVSLNANVRAAAGSVTLKSKPIDRNEATGELKTTGQVSVGDGVSVDLSGLWVNQALTGAPANTQAVGGGSFVATGYGVSLGQGSVIDVSGGGSVSTAGVVTGAAAGAIALKDISLPGQASDRTMVLGGELRGYSAKTNSGVAAGGGSLSLSTHHVQVGVASTAAAPDALQLNNGFFSQGGFGSVSVDGRESLDVAAGTQIDLSGSAWRANAGSTLAPTGIRTADALEAGLATGVRAAPVNLTLSSSGNSDDLSAGVLTVGTGARITSQAQGKINLSAAHQLVFDGQIQDQGGSVKMAVRGSDTVTANALWLGANTAIDVSGTTLLTPDQTNGLRQGSVIAGGSISLAAGYDGTGAANGKPSELIVQQGATLNAAGSSGSLDVTTLGDSGKNTVRTTLHSNGGNIALASNGGLLAEGTLDLHSGGGTAAGGSLSVQANASDVSLASGQRMAARELLITDQTQARTVGLTLQDLPQPSSKPLVATFSAQQVRESGAADFSALSTDAIRFADSVNLSVGRTLTLQARTVAAQAGTQVQLSAANAFLGWTERDLGASATDLALAPAASTGTASFSLSAINGLVLDGQVATRGFGTVSLNSAGEMRLQSRDAASGGRLAGALNVAGDLNLATTQLYVATDTDFHIDASGHTVHISGGDRNVAKPLSAAATLQVDAQVIEQDGVVRTPFGQIRLNATDRLVLGAGSETSVSGQGLLVPYGTAAGSTWTTPGGSTLDALNAKRIVLQAAQVETQAGSTLDLSGGGELQGTEFVAGKGGSTDILANASGAYAIVPTVQGLSAFDASFSSAGAASAMGRQIVIAKTLTLPDGSVLKAGSYTLLPARYAMQPGAFLVRASSVKTTLAAGNSVANTDGSVTLGAVLADAGTAYAAEVPSNWQLMSQATALTYSEVRQSQAGIVLADKATRAGTVAANLPANAGSLVVAASSATLAGNGLFDGGRDRTGQVVGLGGRAEFVADRIQVDNSNAASALDDGVLHLQADALNQLGAYSLLLGGRTDAADSNGQQIIDTTAFEVVFAQGSQALKVPDLVATATGTIQVNNGAKFVATGTAAGKGVDYQLTGDGAAVRVAADAGAGLTRTGVSQQAGQLSVGAHASFDTQGGALVLDSTSGTQVAASAKLLARAITLAGGDVVVGAGSTPPNTLTIGPALLTQVSDAQQLTLRGYGSIEVRDGTTLGQAALDSLTLDTGHLKVKAGGQARVEAGEITLTNTSGSEPTSAGGGTGQLTLKATQAQGGSGQIRLANGSMAVDGVADLQLQADGALALAGDSTLRTSGQLGIQATGVVAQTDAASLTVKAQGSFQLHATEGASELASATGGSLNVSAAAIDVAGRIVLPSGQVALSSAGDVHLASTARVNVAGRSVQLDDQTVDQAGGDISLTSTAGQLRLNQGARLDVSGAGTAGDGGHLGLSAAQGTVQTQATLLGKTGAHAAQGATLNVDAGSGVDMARVVAAQANGQFNGAVSVRQRHGDLTLAAEQTLTAQNLALEADGGQLDVRGTLDARGADGGRINLAANGAVLLADGAQLLAQARAANGAGGRVELTSAQGTLQLGAGSLVALNGGSTGEGGRLTLRAQRTQAGTEVDIDPLAGRITGAERIDVQAVKRYDHVTRISDLDSGDGVLNTGVLAADALTLVGARGDNARAIASRLAGGNSALADALAVHAEAEVRSDGDLAVQTSRTWTLSADSQTVQANGGSARQVGDSSVTLRAAGSLTVQQSIESGFQGSGTSAAGQAGGTIRLVAGADMAAASATTVSQQPKAHLVFSRLDLTAPVQQQVVRSTTGDVQLAASGNIDMRSGWWMAYTTGGALSDEQQALADQLGVNRLSGLAFGRGAGDLRLSAGGSVLSREVYRQDTDQPLITSLTAWSVQQQTFDDGVNPVITGWFSDLGQVQHGVASFGGGRVDVQAGKDVVNLLTFSPSSGYRVDGSSQQTYAGGSVSVRAGRDVVNGMVESGGRSLNVTAGRDIAWVTQSNAQQQVDSTGLRLIAENGTMDVAARRDITLGNISSRFLRDEGWLQGLDADAKLRAVAASGSLALNVARTANDVEVAALLPADTVLAAPQGDVAIATVEGLERVGGGLLQAPVNDGRLEILAGGSVTLGTSVQVNATSQSVTPGTLVSDTTELANALGRSLDSVYNLKLADDAATLDQSSRSPVQVVAQSGDLHINADLTSARPVRLVAGNDVALNNEALIVAQHQPAASGQAQELSLIQAGRDVQFNGGMMRVVGAGDTVVLAGRDIDLGSANRPGLGSGLMTVGNTDNGLLPAASSTITLVAGLRSDGQDYTQAVREGFQALGSAALADHAGDVYALLTASNSDSNSKASTVTLGSEAAQAFTALSTSEQLAKVRAVMGSAAYNQALADYVRGLQGNQGLSDAQALAVFAQQSLARQDAAPAALLATALAGLPQATRTAFVASLASTAAPRTAQALQAWMKLKTGQDLSLADAIVAFEALPLERQVGWIDQVLVDEVRAQGRVASQTTGYDAEAAWLRGYLAINTVFGGERPSGDVLLPNTQAKTLQQANTTLVEADGSKAAITLGAITLLAPGGGVNAGETGSSTQSANNLGIVTVAGGDIAAIVQQDFLVNQSRVFSLDKGDILLWASSGDIDAGRGAKTVSGAPAPVLRLDPATGKLVLDTSGSFTGSGIAVLNAASDLDLYAPSGAIDAGEAGIKSKGNVFLGAQVVRGGDNISAGGAVSGTAITPAAVSPVASLASVTPTSDNHGDEDDQKRRRRQARRQLLLEFLGFGRG